MVGGFAIVVDELKAQFAAKEHSHWWHWHHDYPGRRKRWGWVIRGVMMFNRVFGVSPDRKRVPSHLHWISIAVGCNQVG
jgi:hypothetical protein